MAGHVDDFHRAGDRTNAKWNEIRRKIDALYKWGSIKNQPV